MRYGFLFGVVVLWLGFGKGVVADPQIAQVDPAREICFGFDYGNAYLDWASQRFILTDGRTSIASFKKSDRKAANIALEVVKRLKVTHDCYFAKGYAILRYSLSKGRAPVGTVEGEYCQDLDYTSLRVAKHQKHGWMVADNAGWFLPMANSKGLAEFGLDIIQKYRFGKFCILGRGARYVYMKE